MTTRSTAFQSKIRSLNEYYNNIVNCSLPVANTGADIATTLKYFSQTLLSILKEITLDENALNDVIEAHEASRQLYQSQASTSIHQTQSLTTTSDILNDNDKSTNILGLSESSNTLGTIVTNPKFQIPQSSSKDNVASSTGAGISSSTGPATSNDLADPAKNNNRIKKFPNLGYSTLYHSLLNIIEIIPTIQTSQIAVGQALIQTFGCLAPFLTDDLIKSLPYTIALTLTTFPRDLHKCIMEILCNTLLPIALNTDNNNVEDSLFMMNSISSIIMIVLQFGNDTAYHVQLFECLLSLKRNLIEDILCAISYGTYKVKYHATNLLFRYWPKLNPNKSDRNVHYHYIPRKPMQCQSERCIERKNQASKVCLDPIFSMHGANTPPPYHVCSECYREIPKKYQLFCHNLVLPVEEISLYCENRNCKANDIVDKIAIVICYSSSCIILNQNKPISLCKDCHTSKHRLNHQRTDHIFQVYIDNLWTCSTKTKTYLSTSIINLLKEVPVLESKRNQEFMEHGRKRAASQSAPSNMNLLTNAANSSSVSTMPATAATSNLPPALTATRGDLTSLIGVGLIGALNTNGYSNTSALASTLFASGSSSDESNFNKRLLSRYGVYLVYNLIKPNEFGPLDLFGRIISMILQWHHYVCYLPNDASGELTMKIREQFVVPWLKKVIENHVELVVSCLLPSPPDFARVGGVWETKSNTSTQLREEFCKFCDLIPDEIVNIEIWDYAIPFWVETIINDVSEKHIQEFRPIFVKLFDPDLTPFKNDIIYKFVSERFEGTSSTVQEQALSWLQLLCELDVSIPLQILVNMFQTGLNSLQKLETRAMRRREAYLATLSTTESQQLLQQQQQQQNQPSQYNNQILMNNAFTVFDTYEAYRVYRNQLMHQQMTGQELAILLKEEEEDFIINNSELNISCCIMMLDMILKQFDLQRSPQHHGVYHPLSKEYILLMSKQLILPWAKKHKCKQQYGFLSAESISISTNSNANYCQFCEEYVLWFSFAKDILVHISSKQECELPEINFHHLIESLQNKSIESNENANQSKEDEGYSPTATAATTPKKAESKTDPDVGIWVTSYGVYYFKFSQLQPHLQLLHSMLKELYRVPDVDAFYNLLMCLKMLIIHGDCLEVANKEQKGFLIYCLEKLLVPNLWRLFSADYCHLNDIAVPLLLYSLLYESGRNTFWILVDKDFKDPSWKIRMQAVSKCICIAQHLKLKQIRASCNIFSSLSFAFCNLINSINDIEPIVAQKAITLFETLSDQAIKSIISCFELQFDCVIVDRPLIIQVLSNLYSILNTKSNIILSWEFFMNRFNSISIENQLVNDVLSPVDLSGVNVNNNNFQRKINIAKFSLKRSDLVKPISPDFKNNLNFVSNFKFNSINTDNINDGVDQSGSLQIDLIKEHEHLNKQILHSLITLLMKFMVQDDQSAINEDRIMIKQQNVVLKHLYSLIKYNLNEHLFSVTPNILRKTTAVNAFLSGLPMVLDRNFALGNNILQPVLRLLRYLPLPAIEESISIRVCQLQAENSLPTYTIGLLNSQARHAWILSLTIILYKYQYNSNSGQSGGSSNTNTLNANSGNSSNNTITNINNTLNHQGSLNSNNPLLNVQNIGSGMNNNNNLMVNSNNPNLGGNGIYNSSSNNSNFNNLTLNNEFLSQNVSILIRQLLQIVINTLKNQFHKCQINSIDPIRLNLSYLNNNLNTSQNSNNNRYINRDCPSQKSINSTDVSININNTTLIESLNKHDSENDNINRNDQQDDDNDENDEYYDDNIYECDADEDDAEGDDAVFNSTEGNNDNLSHETMSNKSRRLSIFNKKLLAINVKTKSNSSNNLNNQASTSIRSKNQNVKNKSGFKKGIKVLSKSQTRIDNTAIKSKNPKGSKKDTDYEAVLLDPPSQDIKFSKSCPLNITKLFKPAKNQNIGLKKVKKTGFKLNQTNIPLLNLKTMNMFGNAGTANPAVTALTSSSTGLINSNSNTGYTNQAGRRSAVITSNGVEHDNHNGVGSYLPSGDYASDDNDFINVNNHYLVMNSTELYSGEYGLSYIKCQRCNSRIEYYSEDSLGGMIVICSTIVHRECALAAPFILDMIIAIIRIASKKMYSWQSVTGNYGNFYLPGNYTSVAKQFIRCVLHQLISNEIFFQLFQCKFESNDLFETLAIALNDFNELSSVAALRQIIHDINLQKTINLDVCMKILNNSAIFIEYLPNESQHNQWTSVIQELDTLFKNLEPVMNKSYDYTCLFVIMINLLKVTNVSNIKTILEPFSKLLSFILQHCTFKLEHLVEICSLSNRAFTKDRDKHYLPRCIINELIQNITVKVTCIDRNLLLILQLAVLDAGGNIYKSAIIEDESELYNPQYYIQTNAADCLKQYINDIMAFIADIHTLNKIKQNLKLDKNLQSCPSEDTLGAQLKAGLAQFLSLEFTELNKYKDRDARSIVKYLPWLNNLPTNQQQGAKEFVECIDHIRFLSWILIGSLTHSALTRNKGNVISYPIPINCGNYIGEHIFYILNGFAEHSKTSAIHMSSLFHSFILCQNLTIKLWTMYCEQIHVTHDTENDSSALNAIMEFWTKITPGILQLLSQTKVLADMVILHFLSLIEGLQEYNSLVLAKFFPMWVQVLFMSPLQGDQLKRAKQCLNYQPPTETQINTSVHYNILIKCLQRLQYKVAMIEMQSSNAALLYNS